MIYKFKSIESDRIVLLEKYDNELIYTSVGDGNKITKTNRVDEFYSLDEFENYCDDIIQDLLFDDELYLEKVVN